MNIVKILDAPYVLLDKLKRVKPRHLLIRKLAGNRQIILNAKLTISEPLKLNSGDMVCNCVLDFSKEMKVPPLSMYEDLNPNSSAFRR